MQAAGYNWLQSTAAKTEVGDRAIRLNEAVALAAMFEVDLGELVRPELHPLIARIQKEAGLLAMVEGDAAETRRVLQETQRIVADTQERIAALRNLLDYLDNPSAERWAPVIAPVIRLFDLSEQLGIAHDLGIDQEAWRRAIADGAADTVGTDASDTDVAMLVAGRLPTPPESGD